MKTLLITAALILSLTSPVLADQTVFTSTFGCAVFDRKEVKRGFGLRKLRAAVICVDLVNTLAIGIDKKTGRIRCQAKGVILDPEGLALEFSRRCR
jgi:hypothetical protein